MANWHPDARRQPYPSAGSFVNAGHKIVWHTTEGSSLPVYSGSAPHFTFNPSTGDLWQHVPINEAASSLMHPAGTVETNHAHAIQVELIGRASQTPHWPESYYERIARLARWIESNAGVPSRVVPHASFLTPRRLGVTDWLGGSGHCGHMHVPNNDHTDPGAGFRIGLVLAKDKPKPIAFTRNEKRTLYLLMTVRKRPSTVKRRAAIAGYKFTLRVYRSKLRAAAAVSGWAKNDRRRRYNAILTVYKGGTVALD